MTERLTAVVGARIGEYRRRMAEARAIASAFPNRIVTQVVVNTKTFRNRMDKLADVYRDFNIVGTEMLKGGMLALFPVLIAMVPALIAVLGTAGVQIGVMAGGLMALASSFSVASLGVLGLGSALIPTVKRIVDEIGRAHV